MKQYLLTNLKNQTLPAIVGGAYGLILTYGFMGFVYKDQLFAMGILLVISLLARVP